MTASTPRRERRCRVRACLTIVALALLPLGIGCRHSSGDDNMAVAFTGGNPARGRRAMQRYSCTACHTVPGIQGADARVGPPLAGIASRVYIAGVLPNTADNLERWIMDPQGVDEHTAMPYLGVTLPDARDIAAYLYTLK